MTFQEFYKLYPQNWMIVRVFIKSPEELNVEAEVKKFEGFTKLLKENSFVKSSVTIVYLKPNAYQQYDEVRSQEAIY